MCVWFFGTVTLLNIPGFIERLCKLATRKVSEATGANFQQELEDWYTWLDNALVLDALMQMATEETEQSSTGETSDNRPEIENWRTLSWGLLVFFSTSRVLGRKFFSLQSPETSTASVNEDCPWDHVQSGSALRAVCPAHGAAEEPGAVPQPVFFFSLLDLNWSVVIYQNCLLLCFLFAVTAGPQDVGWVQAHPRPQQPIWQAHLEEVHHF